MTLPSEKEIYQIIGNKIRETRIKLGLSQIALSQKIGLARTSLTNIENGEQKIPIHILYKLAEQLKVSIADLLLDSEENKLDIASLLNNKVIATDSGTKDSLDDDEKKRILDQVKKQRRQKND